MNMFFKIVLVITTVNSNPVGCNPSVTFLLTLFIIIIYIMYESELTMPFLILLY